MEQISIHKFPGLCELEQRYGVNIGTNYTTEISARNFVHFITEAQPKKKLVTVSQQAKILFDFSTDSRNVENELLLVEWFDKDGKRKSSNQN